MTEECESCGRDVTKYLLLDIMEIEDVADHCSEVATQLYYVIIAEVYSRSLKLKKQ